MSNEIIASLHQNIVFVENLHMNNQIIAQLLILYVASKIKIVVSKIIDSNIADGISNNKKIRFINHTSSRVHFGWASLRIVNQYLSKCITLSTN